MSGIVELAVPCRLVALKVLLGPESGLTTLEDLVARAIAADRTTVEQQVDLFGLPERIIVDVVHSLWSKGHVLVRFDSGELDLTDGAREMLMEGGLRDVSTKQETRRFLFEPVTGQIFPEHRGDRRSREGSLELPAHHGVTEADLSASDLLEAVQSAVRYDRRRTGFRDNVLDVGFGSPVLRPPEELRWLSVRVTARIDAQTDRLAVRLIDDDHMWATRARQRMAEHLMNLVDEQPDHEFVRKFTGQADHGLTTPETLQSLLAQMSRRVARLPDTEVGMVEREQKELHGLATTIAERIADAELARAAVTLIEGTAGYTWAVEDLIGAARNQIVVSSPLIHYHALNQCLPLLRERLDKGVGLVVLWGRSSSDVLDAPVRTALNELKTRYPAQVLFEERSTQTDACVLVQDGHRALFGSRSPLATEKKGDKGELGVLVEPAADGPAVPRCVAEALLWARKNYPFAGNGARIQLRPDDPGGGTGRARGPELAEHLPDPDLGNVDEATVRLWAESWAEHHAAILDAIRRATDRNPSVELVRDSAHRDLIASALTTRSDRLVITDDRIDPRVANDAMARQIREIASAGASVHLVHPPTTVTGNVGKAFAELSAAQDAGVHVRKRHAGIRAVLSGENVLLGSFSPLSEGGHNPRSGRVGQLGLLVRGRAIADAFADALGVPRVPGAAPGGDVPGAEARPRSGVAAQAALPLLEQARMAPGPEGFTAVVHEQIRRFDDPWAVLDLWERVGVPAAELRRGAAVVLGLDGDARPAERERWARWLVADAWRRRAFIEGAVVGRLLPRPADVAACAAAVPLEAAPVGEIGDLLLSAALTLVETDATPRLVGAVGGIADALLRGGEQGGEVALMLADALPDAWRGLAEAAAERGSGRPLPMKTFASALERSTDRADAEDAWAGVAARIDQFEGLRGQFIFEAGGAMHERLLTEGGLLALIREAARDPGRRPHLAAELPGSVRQHLDGLIREAGGKPIAGRVQTSFVRRIESIVRTARTLVSREGEHADPGARDEELDGCRRLGKELADRWDDLFSEVGRVEDPYGQPMLALLERLRPLYDWYREEQRGGRR
ncbi:hypothetical protein ACFHW2_13805 [Actinomadura sp. LOL_016]|uniref:hypothetical protein n=1 Tax=unclassified Actinomadura TaxID=2626254 RepID=UPI003A7F7A61